MFELHGTAHLHRFAGQDLDTPSQGISRAIQPGLGGARGRFEAGSRGTVAGGPMPAPQPLALVGQPRGLG